MKTSKTAPRRLELKGRGFQDLELRIQALVEAIDTQHGNVLSIELMDNNTASPRALVSYEVHLRERLDATG